MNKKNLSKKEVELIKTGLEVYTEALGNLFGKYPVDTSKSIVWEIDPKKLSYKTTVDNNESFEIDNKDDKTKEN